MKKLLSVLASFLLLLSLPSEAGGIRIGFSVNFGYVPVVYSPPVVVCTQPAIVYTCSPPVPVVYVRPAPVVYVYPAPAVYVHPNYGHLHSRTEPRRFR